MNESLRAAMTKTALAQLEIWANDSAEDQRYYLTALLELPLLLRTHGLAATTGYWYADTDKQKLHSVAQRFVEALHSIAPIAAPDTAARVAHLRTEGLGLYLLHSRLALVLADAWVEIAEPLLPKARKSATGSPIASLQEVTSA